MGSVGIYLFIEGWRFIQLHEQRLPISVRLELLLMRLFQGENTANRVRKKKSSPEAIRSYGVSAIVLGTTTIVMGAILIIEALVRLRLK
jgi:hypothetical protein